MSDIKSLILLAETHNNIIHFDLKNIRKQYKLICTNFMADIIFEVEKWDLIVDKIFMHPMMKSIIIDRIDQKYINLINANAATLWGSNIIFDIEVPSDTVVAASELYEKYSYGVSMGKVDINKLNRLNKLKAFW